MADVITNQQAVARREHSEACKGDEEEYVSSATVIYQHEAYALKPLKVAILHSFSAKIEDTKCQI